jgi:hypothetical protein
MLVYERNQQQQLHITNHLLAVTHCTAKNTHTEREVGLLFIAAS